MKLTTPRIVPNSVFMLENVANGTTIATFTVLNPKETYNFFLDDDGLSNAFTLAGNELRKNADIDYASFPSDAVVVRITGATSGQSVSRTIPIYVIDVAGYPSGASPVNTGLPAISGLNVVTRLLDVSNGTWTNSPTSYTYQWKRDGANISGATSANYRLVQADIGAIITCTVTAINGSGSASATSAGTLPIATLIMDAPILTKTSAAGQNPLTFDTELDIDTVIATDVLRLQLDDNAGFTSPQAETKVLTVTDINTQSLEFPTLLDDPMPDGTHYVRMRVESPHDASIFSPWSNTLTDSFNLADLWTPDDLSVLPYHWRDAQDLTTIQHTAGSVTTFNDKGTAASHATQTNAADRPLYVTNSNINNYPAIRIAGNTTQHLDTSATYGSMTDFQFGGAINQIGIKLDGVDRTSTAYTALNNVPALIAITWSAGTGTAVVTFWQNGTQVSQITGLTIANAGAIFCVFRATSAGTLGLARFAATSILFNRASDLARSFDGDFGEQIYLSYDPVQADREKIEGYAAHRWGMASVLPVAHPYKSSAPANAPPPPTTYRYWQLYITAVGSGNYAAISELELAQTLGGANAAQIHDQLTSNGHFGGMPGYAPGMIFDGDVNTLFHSVDRTTTGGITTITIDFGPTQANWKAFQEMRVTSRNDGNHNQAPVDYKLRASDDGTTYNDVITVTGQTWGTTTAVTRTNTV